MSRTDILVSIYPLQRLHTLPMRHDPYCLDLYRPLNTSKVSQQGFTMKPLQRFLEGIVVC
jgi:hypothetical protein